MQHKIIQDNTEEKIELFAYAMNKSLRRVNNECRLPTVEEILDRHEVLYQCDMSYMYCILNNI